MLDKNIPYKNIIMKLDCDKNSALSEPVLPAGFSFRAFQKGDELGWAEIECAVLEFDAKEQAVAYFRKDYLPDLSELEKRCVFIVNQQEIPIATAIAWWVDCDGKRQASLQWVAVRPDYQGKGFGEAVVQKALSLFPVYERNRDIYLHTQTWSHVAVQLYYKSEFRLAKTARFGGLGNDYAEAVEILKCVMDKAVYLDLVNTAR